MHPDSCERPGRSLLPASGGGTTHVRLDEGSATLLKLPFIEILYTHQQEA